MPRHSSPVGKRHLVAADTLGIVGAYYDLDTGLVTQFYALGL